MQVLTSTLIVGLLAFQGLEELYASYNFVSDISDIEYVEKLHTLDLEANDITDLRQLSNVSSKLKVITLAGNKVADDPKYLLTLLEHGTGLEIVDDVTATCIKEKLQLQQDYNITSPMKVQKMKCVDMDEDKKITERFKKLGLSEEMIRESIDAANSMIDKEPAEDEILRQSIKVQGFKGDKKGKLKMLPKEKKCANVMPTRPATASVGDLKRVRMKKKEEENESSGLDEVEELECEEEEEPRIEGFSELVTTTDKVFVGNPLKAAKHKKQKHMENTQKMDIYSLMDQFKDASTNLKTQVSKKLAQREAVPESTADKAIQHAENALPNVRGPIKARGIISIRRIKYLKK